MKNRKNNKDKQRFCAAISILFLIGVACCACYSHWSLRKIIGVPLFGILTVVTLFSGHWIVKKKAAKIEKGKSLGRGILFYIIGISITLVVWVILVLLVYNTDFFRWHTEKITWTELSPILLSLSPLFNNLLAFKKESKVSKKDFHMYTLKSLLLIIALFMYLFTNTPELFKAVLVAIVGIPSLFETYKILYDLCHAKEPVYCDCPCCIKNRPTNP